MMNFFGEKDETISMKDEPTPQRRTPHDIIRGPLPGLTLSSRNLGQTPSTSQSSSTML
ncbi:hypothetical protein J6590_078841 [Homalodisca vitripennis]|nr:hypothetical protein J6590_078841 [Homalodisca vitripennis]